MSITGHHAPSMFRRYGIINNYDKVAALQLLQGAQQQERASYRVGTIASEKPLAATATASDQVQ